MVKAVGEGLIGQHAARELDGKHVAEAVHVRVLLGERSQESALDDGEEQPLPTIPKSAHQPATECVYMAASRAGAF